MSAYGSETSSPICAGCKRLIWRIHPLEARSLSGVTVYLHPGAECGIRFASRQKQSTKLRGEKMKVK